MRTLIALTVLMLALASAVWWKTTGSGEPDEVPPTTSENANEGIVTIAPGPDSGTGTPSNAAGTSGEASNASMNGEGTEATPEIPPINEDPDEQEEVVKPQPHATGELTHRVKDGETLYRIVLNAYGTAPEKLVEAVATANQLQNSGAIDEDQVLKLPVVEGFPAPSAG